MDCQFTDSKYSTWQTPTVFDAVRRRQEIPARPSVAGAIGFGQTAGLRTKVIVPTPIKGSPRRSTPVRCFRGRSDRRPGRQCAQQRRHGPGHRGPDGAGAGAAARLRAGLLHPGDPPWGQKAIIRTAASRVATATSAWSFLPPSDYMVNEPMMQKAISDRLAYRIGPELTKVFAFDRQFTFDACRAVLQRRRPAFLRRPSRQRRADHRRPRLRRVAQPQRRFRRRRALVFPEYADSAYLPPPALPPYSPARCCTRRCSDPRPPLC